jgi:hypothetical protein
MTDDEKIVRDAIESLPATEWQIGEIYAALSRIIARAEGAERERDEAKEELSESLTISYLAGAHDHKARADRLQAALTEAREALKPFAVDDAAWTGAPDDFEIELRAVDDQPQPCVLLADLRRARAISDKDRTP